MKIGVDGGGSKTELILVDEHGTIVARHLAPGCNPNVAGPLQARALLGEALASLLAAAGALPDGGVVATHLYMAGNPAFWRTYADELTGFGRVHTGPDSLPVLELATDGDPGLAIHAGTGSFIAARDRDGAVHYAGGLGWRLGDPGSGYDIGRRAIARALLELQGWAPPSALGPSFRTYAGVEPADAASLTRHVYTHPEANRFIAGFTPTVLRLANEGDAAAARLATESALDLMAQARTVAGQLFEGVPFDRIRAGLSGHILSQPFLRKALEEAAPFPIRPITEAPIEGVRRLLVRVD
jgi:glucosamine kinase